MCSKLFVSLLVAALVVEMVAACAPTSTTGAATSAATTASTTTKPQSRRRRSADATTIELDSSVKQNELGGLIEKLRAASVDLDAAKYGRVEHEQSVDANGNVVLHLVIPNAVDCAELRQTAQKVVRKVPEIKNAKINCDGQQFQV
ncbi:hypothetical protein M3Y99_00598000 [Aphelenchoides fujianensis]|nr:hypothetical protein M3Y99_00598000 [Aphelenchoides fujianensis]